MKEHLWEVQAAKSFCKMKKDWLSHERIHLSFVKHSGKPECKQELAIEGAIKLTGTDGAVNLSYLILSGRLRKMAEMKKKEAAEKQQKFVEPLFTSMGGTVASRSADGASCTFREFAVLCGTASEYVLRMLTCAGEQTSTGGIQPVSGAKRESIFVPISAGDLVCFAKAIEFAYQEYMTMVCSAPGYTGENKDAPQDPAPANEPQAPANTQTHAPAEHPRMSCIVWETGGITDGLPQAIKYDPQHIVGVIQDMTRTLLKDKRLVANVDDYNATVGFINTQSPGAMTIHYTGKENQQVQAALCIKIAEFI